MRTRALGSRARFSFLGFLCFMLAGCGTTPPTIACPANNNTCGCAVPGSNIMCSDAIPLLYATTTSNQILAFSIGSSGSLTALPPTAGPANSGSVSNINNALMFADASTNAVDSYQINVVTGALTPVQGSPFSLGTAVGGPTSIMIGPYAFFYATEPNGTIVGFSTPSDGTLTAPVPNSPFAAGTSPSQMAYASLASSGAPIFSLYASDAADPNGGILAYYLDSAGSLSPIAGSPFPTLPGAGPSAVLSGAFVQVQGSAANGYLFVSLTNAGKVAVFAIDPSTGALTPVPGSPFTAGNGPGALIEDSFNHLFVMNGGDHTVSAFNIGSNGMLTAIGSPVPAGTADGGMALFPWDVLYVADTASSSIVIFNLDHTTGVLTPAGSPFAVTSPPLQLMFAMRPAALEERLRLELQPIGTLHGAAGVVAVQQSAISRAAYSKDEALPRRLLKRGEMQAEC